MAVYECEDCMCFSSIGFGSCRLQFTTSRRIFRKQWILVLLCLELFCYRSPFTTRYEKVELHAVFFTTLVVVSSKLTSRIIGNLTFNEWLKLHFRFFGNMGYRKGDQTLLEYDATAALNHTHRFTRCLFNVKKFTRALNNFKFAYLLLWLQAEYVCCNNMLIV